MYKCLECGRKFKTTSAASKAVNNGCPKCGGVDIDLDDSKLPIIERVELQKVDGADYKVTGFDADGKKVNAWYRSTHQEAKDLADVVLSGAYPLQHHC